MRGILCEVCVQDNCPSDDCRLPYLCVCACNLEWEPRNDDLLTPAIR